MKKVVLLTAILSCYILIINGQVSSGKDDLMVDNFLNSRIITEKERIPSDTVGRVFNGTFYLCKTGFSSPEGDNWCSESIIIINAGKIIELDNRTDSILPLLALVRKDFLVKGETEAKIIEKALEKLYPLSSFIDEKTERLKIGNSWYFIRGKFFDSKSGYVVTLDKNLRISNIAYSMEAIKN